MKIMQLDLVMEMLHKNLMSCLEEVQEAIGYCEELLTNNNILILIDPALYHRLRDNWHDLEKAQREISLLYDNIENELPGSFLSLTLKGSDLIEDLNDISAQIEKKWEDEDIDINKYFFAQNLLSLNFDTEVVLDIDDLELAAISDNTWVSAYLVQEGKHRILHCATWKTKAEALCFTLQMKGAKREHIFNRYCAKSR